MSISIVQEFDLIICTNCGIGYAVPAQVRAEWINSHQTFYCPNGHSQYYPGETIAERLKRELLQEQNRHAVTVKQLGQVAIEADRLRKRIGAGVCPCCNRTLKQLAAHMKKKHPNYKELQVSEVNALTA